MNHIFVYGTLRPGQKYHQRIKRYVVDAKPAFVKGRIYHLPEGYPALVLEQDLDGKLKSVTIRGNLLEIKDMQAALPILDEIEDYFGPHDPQNLYERVEINTITVKKQVISCSAYVFAGDKISWLEQNAIYIPEGDWVQWLGQH